MPSTDFVKSREAAKMSIPEIKPVSNVWQLQAVLFIYIWIYIYSHYESLVFSYIDVPLYFLAIHMNFPRV